MSINNNIILEKYSKIRLLRDNSNKVVILCKSIFTAEKFIVKMEKTPSKEKKENLQKNVIYKESKALGAMQGHLGFPFLIWSGYEEEIKLCVIQQLGDTLWHKFNVICQKVFSIKTVCLIGLQLFSIVQDYHFKGYMFCKITPQSIQFGMGKNNHKLYFNDLSDSIKFNKEINTNVQRQQDQNYTQFQSDKVIKYNVAEYSPKDDLIALIKMLLQFLGCKYDSNTNKCDYPHIPGQFFIMLQKCQQLKPSEKIHYTWFICLLKQVMFHRNIENDYIYDWINPKNAKKQYKIAKQTPSINLDQYQKNFNIYYQPYQEKISVDYLTDKDTKVNQNKNKKIIQKPFSQLMNSPYVEQFPKVKLKKKQQQCIIM